MSHFQLESIPSVLLSVSQGDWLASFDLREAYIPVHSSASRPFLRFLFRDTVYKFRALCFDLSTDLPVFTWVMAPVSAILHSLGIRIRRYLDTWLVQSSSQESLLVGMSHFQLESIPSVLLSVSQGDWLASFDLREAYIPVHSSASRPFLRFLFRDTVYKFRALCFDLSTDLPVFTWVMAPVSAILHSLGIRIRRYLDTWLVQSSSQESLLEVLLPVIRLCPVFGIVIHHRYSNLIPSQVVQCLWVVFDSTSFRTSPSVERISRRRSVTAVFVSCA